MQQGKACFQDPVCEEEAGEEGERLGGPFAGSETGFERMQRGLQRHPPNRVPGGKAFPRDRLELALVMDTVCL